MARFRSRRRSRGFGRRKFSSRRHSRRRRRLGSYRVSRGGIRM